MCLFIDPLKGSGSFSQVLSHLIYEFGIQSAMTVIDPLVAQTFCLCQDEFCVGIFPIFHEYIKKTVGVSNKFSAEVTIGAGYRHATFEA